MRITENKPENQSTYAKASILSFCVSHVPILFKNNPQLKHIILGDSINKNSPSVHASDDITVLLEKYPDLDFLHPLLGGSAGTFAISRILRDLHENWDEYTSISIGQYRKFISKTIHGIPAKNYPGMFLMSASDAKDFDVLDMQSSITTPFLLASPIQVGNLLQQYAACHRVEDLLRYSAIAIELGVIDHTEVSDFFNASSIIPGGIEFGIFPASIFVEITSKLESICINFTQRHQPAAMDRHQRRALSFCNERMGSYLLVKILNSISPSSIPADWLGHMHTIADTPAYESG